MIKWHLIKTKEDVPPASRDYLVTCIIKGRRYVTIDRPYTKYMLLNGEWNEWENSRKVIAWAEMPKPFSGALK